MRITPIILIFIGLAGLIYPEKFIADGSGGGRWVFVIIIALGAWTIWRSSRNSQKR
ncbi:hypothetical protein [uncultured Bartonella sp.]|uniref:hypothetical protein n=1 Tax=uncultured Bartonella sp. TaxID=104108 RepID=UPI0026190B68|nr:hypothetical protein [uncultured Bartonella sp.]